METKSVRNRSWDALNLEEIAWSCGCGTPMALESPTEDGKDNLLKCRVCGPVAVMRIRLEPVRERTKPNGNE